MRPFTASQTDLWATTWCVVMMVHKAHQHLKKGTKAECDLFWLALISHPWPLPDETKCGNGETPVLIFGSQAVIFTQCYFGCSMHPKLLASSPPTEPWVMWKARKERNAKLAIPAPNGSPRAVWPEKIGEGRFSRSELKPRLALLLPDWSVIHSDPAKCYFLYISEFKTVLEFDLPVDWFVSATIIDDISDQNAAI